MKIKVKVKLLTLFGLESGRRTRSWSTTCRRQFERCAFTWSWGRWGRSSMTSNRSLTRHLLRKLEYGILKHGPDLVFGYGLIDRLGLRRASAGGRYQGWIDKYFEQRRKYRMKRWGAFANLPERDERLSDFLMEISAKLYSRTWISEIASSQEKVSLKEVFHLRIFRYFRGCEIMIYDFT